MRALCVCSVRWGCTCSLSCGEQISQLNEELRASRRELSEEIKVVDRLNEQLQNAMQRADDAGHEAASLREANSKLLEENESLEKRLKSVILDAPSSDSVKEWEREASCAVGARLATFQGKESRGSRPAG